MLLELDMPPNRRERKTGENEMENKSKNRIVSSDVVTRDLGLLHFEDILEKIFSFLDYDTLCIVQCVCRFWQKKAHERLLKNYPPVSVYLPVLYCGHFNHFLDNPEECIEENTMIKNLLKTEPEKVALIMTDGAFPEGYPIFTYDCLDNILDDYLNFLHPASFVVHEFIFVDDVEIKGTENLMTAVFFPDIPSIDIRYSLITETRIDKNFDYSDVLVELFDIGDPKDKGGCFIILGLNHKNCKPQRNSKFIQGILNYLKNTNESQKLTVWGGAHVEIVNASVEFDSQDIQWHMLRIVGINSYSIALNLDMDEDTFKKKLQDFKKTIILKKETFALAVTHTKDSKTEEKALIMKKVLWFKDVFNIRLTTILSYIEDYSCDPIIFCNASDNADLKIENKNTVGYLIISN